jgi:hypothetical protein
MCDPDYARRKSTSIEIARSGRRFLEIRSSPFPTIRQTMIVACGRFCEARRYTDRLPRRDIWFANALLGGPVVPPRSRKRVGCTGATAPGCFFLGAGRGRWLHASRLSTNRTAADEGERYAICLRRLDRASFPQRVCRSARRAKPAECFGATGLSGQCVVLWRAELGRVPIEAVYL